jgi:hypothetical protein
MPEAAHVFNGDDGACHNARGGKIELSFCTDGKAERASSEERTSRSPVL